MDIRSTLARVGVAVTGAALLLSLAACSPESKAAPVSESATRTITDIAGEVEIPTHPQRVVSVDYYSPAMLVDLGVTPVGVVEGFDDDAVDSRPAQYPAALRSVPTVGTYYEINIEAVLKQKPDMILAETRFLGDGQLESLKKIAPVVQLDAAGKDAWKERSIMIADSVNKLDEGKAQRAAFEERAAKIATEYADVFKDRTLAVLGSNPEYTEWATYPSGHFYVVTWDSIGAPFRGYTDGEAGTIEGGIGNWLPLEQMGKLSNADIIISPYSNDGFLASLKGNAVWENLPAVKNGQVFKSVPAAVTSSFVWGMDNLDDVEPILAKMRESMNK